MVMNYISFIISHRIKEISEGDFYDDDTKVKMMLELSMIHLKILSLGANDEEDCGNDNLSQEEVDFWNQSDDPLNMREVQDAIYEKRDLRARGII